MRDASHTFHSSSKLFALASVDIAATDDLIARIDEAKSVMMDTVGVI
jgi:hypothetical protein